jgi:uncharacterized lipoprotein YddW (UPF0748 family)
MNRNLLLVFLSFALIFTAHSQSSPKRELRGAWISSYFGLDWPNKNDAPATQRTKLIDILNHHKATGINAIYFQVRSQSDALYPSAIEPWSNDLTGTQGVAPNPVWDPLQFAIEETHKRGMELHAWLNPYRAVGNTAVPAATHVSNTHPEWMMRSGTSGTTTLKILNPALAGVRDHIVSVIEELLNNYDIDGIHFDDYFYPTTIVQADDDAAYNADRRGFTTKADWRRDNVNLLIKRVNETIIAKKPWVKFGVSPSGIYRNSTNPAIGTDTRGLEHYTSLYADTRRWLQEGWVDYIAPQVYWNIGFYPTADYARIVPWWNDNAAGRHIYIGLATYRVNEAGAWQNRSEIPNQIRLNRSLPNVYGGIHFRTLHLRNNPLGVRDSLRLDLYRKPALLPNMPWRDSTPPAAPGALEAVRGANNAYILTWTKPAATDNEMDRARQFAIYRSETPVVDLQNSDNLLAITNTDESTFTDNTTDAAKTYYYAVTSLDRFHNESAPSNVTDYAPPTITGPGQQQLNLGTACTVALPDYTSMATVSDDVTAIADITITQSPAAGSTITGSATTTVTLTATDASGKTATWSFEVVTNDTEAPVITTCAANQNVGTDAGVCTATVAITAPVATDNCGVASLTGTRSDNLALTAAYPKGVTTITWVATDAAGNTSATCTQTIMVSDTEAPTITNLTADPSVLTPPNHKMRDVTIAYTLADNCGPVTSSIAVSSNEPENGNGDGGNNGPDWKIIDNHHVQLRAERSGKGDGRVYTITVTATDAAGNKTTRNVTVTVPHSAGQEEKEQLEVKVLPNPTVHSFVVLTHSRSTKPLSVIISDNNGKVIERKNNVPANGMLLIGHNYRPGVYYLEVTQGKEKESIKLIKRGW